jgi:hypothetical protein
MGFLYRGIIEIDSWSMAKFERKGEINSPKPYVLEFSHSLQDIRIKTRALNKFGFFDANI